MPARKESTTNTESPGTSSAERFVALLTALAQEGRPLGITEVSELTDLPPATVHRLLGGLVAQGWVDKDSATSRYRLGHGLLGIANVALSYSPLLERGQPIINRVAESAGATALISVLVGRNVVYLARSSGSYEAVRVQTGMLRPAHCSASGKVMLAFLPRQQRERLYRGRSELRSFTPRTISSVEALFEELEGIRRRGYALDDCEFREYQRAVGVPIHDARGDVIAAMSCTGRVELMTDEHLERVREEMTELAEELARHAGFSDD